MAGIAKLSGVGILGYIGKVISRAFAGPYKWRGYVVHIGLSILVSILAYRLVIPEELVIDTLKLQTFFNNLIETVPENVSVNLPKLVPVIAIGVVLLFGIPRLFVAPYLLYRDQERKLLPSPRIEVTPAKEVDRLLRASPVAEQSAADYGVVQAWYVNSPDQPGEGAAAESIEARIRFFEGRSEQFAVSGLWLTGTVPGHAGYSGHIFQTDISPGFVPTKLAIVLKYQNEDECYAYCLENLSGDVHGRSEKFRLGTGVFQIRVDLLGNNLNENFRYALRNLGSGEFPELRSARWYDRVLPQTEWGFGG